MADVAVQWLMWVLCGTVALLVALVALTLVNLLIDELRDRPMRNQRTHDEIRSELIRVRAAENQEVRA